MTSLNKSGDTQFTVFIRLPFPRGDFVDPPPVEWNAAKDQALWDLLSRPSKGDDIDWKALAESFDVTLQFLLQQAAWLYDRQLAQVRAQMRKVGGTTQSNSPSPAPGSVSGSTALGNQPSKGAPPSTGSRVPPRLSLQQKDNPPPRGIGSRRTSSTTTVNQIKALRDSPRIENAAGEPKDPRRESYGRRPSTSRREQALNAPVHKSPPLEEEDLSSSSSESESDDNEVMGSRRGHRFRPFGPFSMHRPGLRDDDEDEDESPAFVPLSPELEPAQREAPVSDLNATLRDEPADARRRMVNPSQVQRQPFTTESPASSISSGYPADRRRRADQGSGPLSPRRTELGYSPRRSVTSGREASDGTPSMGSSYSDLDDASVTQSALEEALMSNMQHGGMASRMSTFSQALRSRYL
ncbi:hypothetical protein P170DRAFT_434265 [Aspergillus steynii IBT 23096]|uniref:Autophagy-related protein 29 n=1 Tax=Aspergillus steynii IBT 23096 TaxID=1392250 RepID=A0A2I2GI42_9EURO|nr:uncharacterized protein P170DRAFT_434265 [Aspergillus steynii IBT 23096]PLB52541.1 hypothetical protein P170DRAFT_434265 [Aspergillus steynii IBT 23096]